MKFGVKIDMDLIILAREKGELTSKMVLWTLWKQFRCFDADNYARAVKIEQVTSPPNREGIGDPS